MLRRLFVLSLLSVAVGAFTAPAFGARPAGFSHTVQSRHFLVHYVSDPADPSYATERQAGMLATLADHAYDTETGWGFPAPANDGDGLVDVYLADLSALGGALAYAQAESAVAPSTGYIVFGVAEVDAPDEGLTIAHELFHLIQYDSWSSATQQDSWLFEGTAEWAAAKAVGFPGDLATASGPADVSLDCRDDIDGFQMCDPSAYIEGGYSRWPFFQAVAERYGVTFVQSVLANGAAGMSSIQALAASIGSKGGSLADVYSDWSVMQMAGGYGIPTLDTLAPTTYATISTGATTGLLSTVTVPVDHLATRYIKFTRGDNAGDHPCFAATLTIAVTFPGVVATRPYFYWNGKGSKPVALTLSGNTATAKLPWDTCLWAANAGYLSLSNLTTNVDSVDFVVSGSLDVDSDTPASAGAAPTQVPVYGGQTPVSNADIAPEISVFGPLLLKVSTTSPTLRLIVEASGEGHAHATLGGTDLGTPALRPGNNDLRFTLPKSVLASLERRLSVTGSVLTLTPVSSSGSATGTAVTRSVTVTQPKPKKTKKK
jgi:hypothetical protein